MSATRRLVVIGLLALAAPASAQIRPMGRADIAILNPDSAKNIHLTYDLGAGVDLGAHYTVLLDVARQNLSSQIEGFGATWVTLVGGAVEYAFGNWQQTYRRQFTLGVRAGMMQPHGPYLSAPYLGFSVGFRYPVAPMLRIDGHLEDILGFLPRQTATVCDGYGDCFTNRVGGTAQQNFGLFLGFEVHPPE